MSLARQPLTLVDPAGLACLLALVMSAVLLPRARSQEERVLLLFVAFVAFPGLAWSAFVYWAYGATGDAPMEPPLSALWYGWLYFANLGGMVHVVERWASVRGRRWVKMAVAAAGAGWLLSSCNACVAAAAI